MEDTIDSIHGKGMVVQGTKRRDGMGWKIPLVAVRQVQQTKLDGMEQAMLCEY